jgi:hypothetical protein
MRTRYVALLSMLVLAPWIGSAICADADADNDAESDERTLLAAKVRVDAKSLLELFRKRSPDAAARVQIEKWIEQLGSISFAEREEASAELEAMGAETKGLLRRATHHVDLEIRKRASHALSVVEHKDYSSDVLLAALRLLARRPPEQMIDVLLEYAPHADDDEDADIFEQVCRTLAAGKRGGAADPLLVRALKDASPRKRAAAVSALCRAGCREHFPAARGLLRDEDPEVRRRAAQALLEAREKAAVPVLIDLLAELPRPQADSIESLLLQLPGDDPPKGSLENAVARARYRDAWAVWWKHHGETFDLAKVELTPRWRDYTLAICIDAMRGRARSGGLVEYDGQGHKRWQMPGLGLPVDAQVLDEKRILVVEYRPGQVTERNRDGDILRRISVNGIPLEARRLPNGRTLITTREGVVEVDRNDKEVWGISTDRTEFLVTACPLRGGEIALCYRSGQLERRNRDGKVLASFRAGMLFRPYGTHIQALPNGHILVPLYYENKVVEYDPTGRVVWQASYARPMSAQRLPNGRTLVASYAAAAYAELDKEGREVKNHRCDGILMSVRGR